MEQRNKSQCFGYRLNNSLYYQSNYSVVTMESMTSEDQLSGLYKSIGICLTMLVNIILSFQFQKLNNLVLRILSYQPIDTKRILRTIIIAVLIVTTPLVFCMALILIIYKNICGFLIKKRNKYFVKFLDGFDVFWNLEDKKCSSVINVVGVIETSSSEEFAAKIREKLLALLENGTNNKIFFKKQEAFGFDYWERCESIDVNEYVKILDFKTDNITENVLEVIMSNVSKQNLSYNDKGLFQILITKQKLLKNNQQSSHGIIFRINHALGDGVSLFNFLCNYFADQDTVYSSKTAPKEAKKFLKEANNNKAIKLRDMLDMANCFADGILREPDENILHGPNLTGEKIFKWIGEDDNLLEVIKSIKNDCEDVNFTDVLATSLSYGLNVFFAKKTKLIPEELAVVLPVRLTNMLTERNSKTLENDFSVTVLDIPIRESSLETVSERCKKMRRSLDPGTNYYFLKLACKIFPKQVLKPLLNSSQATLILSNLPGPDSINICGARLKELVFFVPHKGNTGIGITSLCYGGVLRLAIMADTALIDDGEDLGIILEGMREGLHILHSKYLK